MGLGAHVRPPRPGRQAAGARVRRDRLRRQLLPRRLRAALLPASVRNDDDNARGRRDPQKSADDDRGLRVHARISS